MNLARLPNASYKGFKDLHWLNDSISSGYKKILHEYPNRDRGYIENLGLSILKGSATFRVYNTVNNSTVEAFERVLKDGVTSAGTLVLPTLGTVEDMEVLTWSSQRNESKLGYVEYTIEFAQTSQNQYPASTNINTSFLDRLKNKLLGDNVAAFDKAWNSIKNKKAQAEKALAKIRQTGKAMVDIAKRVEGAGSLVSDFANTISVLTSDAVRLANSPRELATQLKLSFDSLEQSIQNTQVLFNVLKGYFGYNIGDANAIGVGVIQKQIQENQQGINNVIRSNALASAYVFSTLLEYKTTNELNEVRELLKNEYDDLFEKLPDEIAETLQEIQTNANRLFDRQILTLPTLETLNINKQPLGVFLYSYYGSLDNYENIYNINNVKDARQISGQITVVS